MLDRDSASDGALPALPVHRALMLPCCAATQSSVSNEQETRDKSWPMHEFLVSPNHLNSLLLASFCILSFAAAGEAGERAGGGRGAAAATASTGSSSNNKHLIKEQQQQQRAPDEAASGGDDVAGCGGHISG